MQCSGKPLMAALMNHAAHPRTNLPEAQITGNRPLLPLDRCFFDQPVLQHSPSQVFPLQMLQPFPLILGIGPLQNRGRRNHAVVALEIQTNRML